MSPLSFGVCAGLAFGMLAIALMLPLQFPDKRAALLGAFINRFAIGLFIPLVHLPGPILLSGLVVAVLLSLPDAIITKAFAPILVVGAVGGVVIAWIASHVVSAG
jgi:hypothetical protein